MDQWPNDPVAAGGGAPSNTGEAWPDHPIAGQEAQPAASGTYRWANGSIADFPDPDAPKQTATANPGLLQRAQSLVSPDSSGWSPLSIPGIAKGVWNGAKDAASIPSDVASGKLNLDDPSNPQTAGRFFNAAALTTPGDLMPASSMSARVTVPTTGELKSAGTAARKAADGLGVAYDPYHVSDMAAQTQQGLGSMTSVVAPQTHAALNDLQKVGPDTLPMPLSDLDNARKTFGAIAYRSPGASPTDRAAAKQSISAIDAFIANPPQEAVLAGPASQAGTLYNYARGNEAAAFRDDKIQGKGVYAQFRADSAGNGANFDNNLRQQLRPLVDPSKPERLSGFLDNEKQGIADIVAGSPGRNLLRTASTAMGGGLGPVGSLEGLGLGMAGWETGERTGMGGPLGAAVGVGVPFAGRALKGVQNKMAKGALDNLSETIRARSPLYQQKVQNASSMELSPNAPGIGAVRAAEPQLGQQQQPQYAKGGAVKSKHDRLVSRLMSLADKAKAAEKSKTKNILRLSDNTVTTALAKANAAI
jgi:hypothetical protein